MDAVNSSRVFLVCIWWWNFGVTYYRNMQQLSERPVAIVEYSTAPWYRVLMPHRLSARNLVHNSLIILQVGLGFDVAFGPWHQA